MNVTRLWINGREYGPVMDLEIIAPARDAATPDSVRRYRALDTSPTKMVVRTLGMPTPVGFGDVVHKVRMEHFRGATMSIIVTAWNVQIFLSKNLTSIMLPDEFEYRNVFRRQMMASVIECRFALDAIIPAKMTEVPHEDGGDFITAHEMVMRMWELQFEIAHISFERRSIG